MATAMLSIHNSGPGTPKEIFCQSQIGNVTQECAEGFVGTPIPANTVYRDTLAAANAVANAQLDCDPE